MSDGLQISRLFQRLQHLVGRGKVSLVKDDGRAQLLQAVLGQAQTRVETKSFRLGEFGLASNPPIGADVVMIFVAGDRNNGVVIATGHQDSRLKNLQPGEAALHDDQGRWVWLKRDSIEIEAGGKPVNITNATDVTLNCNNLKVTGDIIDHSGSNSVTLKQLRDAYDAHKHPGVTAGGASTNTTDHPV